MVVKSTLRAVLGEGTALKAKFDHNKLKTVYINEEGLYRLMFHCKTSSVLRFAEN